MATTPRVPATPAVLKWARERLGLSVEEAAHAVGVRPDRVVVWETPGPKRDRELPTLAQARVLARKYRQTVAFLMAPEPPPEGEDRAARPPDFRRRFPDEPVPHEVLAELDRAAERRDIYLDLADPPEANLPYTPLSDLQSATAILRETLGVDVARQTRWTASENFLKYWIDAVEATGVLVFQMSRVAPEACQGFALFHDVTPVIVLNGGDSKEVRTFTLFHELAHLLTRSGGVCHTHSGNETERRCNAFAAEFLMPQAVFAREVDQAAPVAQIPALARRFHVSYSAVAVRLRTLGYINQETLGELLETSAAKALETREADRRRARERGGGPPHYATQLRNLGPRFLYTVLDAVDDQRISPLDASYFLESKWGTIRSMEAELSKGAAER